MGKIVVSLFLLVMLPGEGPLARGKERPVSGGDLKVVIIGLRNNKGDVKIGLYNSGKSFSGQGQKYRGAVVEIKEKKAVWVCHNIPFSYYAIKVFHDEDGDDRLDTNFLGIPTERFGFSNNRKVLFGPPDFEKAKFLFHEDNQKIEIILQ